nr:rRNA adenine N-6-methyltransferase family protein [Actinoplanes siamensis]
MPRRRQRPGNGIDATGAHLRRQLVDKLILAGALRSPEWIRAFAEVPRHPFVTRFWWRPEPGRYREFVDGSDPAQRERRLTVVYSDDSLATQLDDAGTATSSSSQPSLMASMLEALAPDAGDTVLEVGTGTGYNTALLAHRLGAGQLTSIEIDPVVAEAARASLLALDIRPRLLSAMGCAAPPGTPRTTGSWRRARWRGCPRRGRGRCGRAGSCWPTSASGWCRWSATTSTPSPAGCCPGSPGSWRPAPPTARSR